MDDVLLFHGRRCFVLRAVGSALVTWSWAGDDNCGATEVERLWASFFEAGSWITWMGPARDEDFAFAAWRGLLAGFSWCALVVGLAGRLYTCVTGSYIGSR